MRKTITVSGELHSTLIQLSGKETVKRQKRVSINTILEEQYLPKDINK